MEFPPHALQAAASSRHFPLWKALLPPPPPPRETKELFQAFLGAQHALWGYAVNSVKAVLYAPFPGVWLSEERK